MLGQSLGENVAGLLFWLLAIVALAVALGSFGYWLRRRMLGNLEIDEKSVGFSLADLRRLHRQGEMSDEEFERAKLQMIAQQRALIARHERERALRKRNKKSPAVAPDEDDDAAEDAADDTEDAQDQDVDDEPAGGPEGPLQLDDDDPADPGDSPERA